MKTKTKRKISRQDLKDWYEDLVIILNECLSSEPNIKLIESKCHNSLYELNWLLSGKDPFDGELELLLKDPKFQRQCEELDNRFIKETREQIINIFDERQLVYDVGIVDELEKLFLKTLNKKSKNEEIQYLGQMLSATTEGEKERIDSIIKRLEEINENNY